MIMQQHERESQGMRYYSSPLSSELLISKRGLEDLSPGGSNLLASRKKQRAPSQPQIPPVCQVEGCSLDLRDSKGYHRRHRVCELHSKTPKSLVDGIEQRFCQQCSRFHILEEFDDGKRSCRKRLAGHNERRRKPPPLGSSSEPIFASPMFNPGDFKKNQQQQQASPRQEQLLNGSFISSWPETQGASGAREPHQQQHHFTHICSISNSLQERMLYEFLKSQIASNSWDHRPPGETGAALSLLSAGQSSSRTATLSTTAAAFPATAGAQSSPPSSAALNPLLLLAPHPDHLKQQQSERFMLQTPAAAETTTSAVEMLPLAQHSSRISQF